MISYVENGSVYEYRGLEEDKEKFNVNAITNGSIFFAMDSVKAYMFDAKNKQWKEL